MSYNYRGFSFSQLFVVVDDEQGHIDDRCRKTPAVLETYVPVIEMQPAGTEENGREVQLLLPVVDDLLAKESLPPDVHFLRDFFRRLHKDIVSLDRQLEVSLVLQGHRRDLTQGIFAIKHPSVGAGEKCVGDVADALLCR